MEIEKKRPKVIAVIPARLGSTRFPGKILTEITGKPLIRHVYENALQCPELESIVIAVDDKSIYDTVVNFGGRAVMTSSNCLTGTDRIVEAVLSDPLLMEADYILNIQGDEPCLEPEVMSRVVKELIQTPDAAMSTAVIELENEDEVLSTSRPKCILDRQGYAVYFSRGVIPFGHRGYQASYRYYGHVGIYCYRKEFLLHYGKLEPSPLQILEDLEQLKVIEYGFRIKVAVVNSYSVGVDTPEDLKKIERILCQKNTCLLPAESVPH